MCQTCYTRTPYILCDACYKRIKAHLAVAEDAIFAGVPADSGIYHNLARDREWCAERDRRIAEAGG